MNELFDRKRQQMEARANRHGARQQQIIQAAIELLDEDGLENLTLRNLAKRLHIQAPALYWHFKNKQWLMDFMAEAILQEEFADLQPRQPDEDWHEWLKITARRLRRAMLAHKEGARVVAGAHMYPAVTLARLSEVCLESLVTAGLDIGQAHAVVVTTIHFTFGRVIEEQASPTVEELQDFDLTDFARLYPYFAQTIHENQLKDRTGESDFNESLDLIIGGVER